MGIIWKLWTRAFQIILHFFIICKQWTEHARRSRDLFSNLMKKRPKIAVFWHFAKAEPIELEIFAGLNMIEPCLISNIWEIEGISIAYCWEISKLAKCKKSGLKIPQNHEMSASSGTPCTSPVFPEGDNYTSANFMLLTQTFCHEKLERFLLRIAEKL